MTPFFARAGGWRAWRPAGVCPGNGHIRAPAGRPMHRSGPRRACILGSSPRARRCRSRPAFPATGAKSATRAPGQPCCPQAPAPAPRRSWRRPRWPLGRALSGPSDIPELDAGSHLRARRRSLRPPASAGQFSLSSEALDDSRGIHSPSQAPVEPQREEPIDPTHPGGGDQYISQGVRIGMA
jgi:hypothetical protein